MAQFYADIQGNRGEATRMGTKDSGICGHIRGWRIGDNVNCFHYNGEDYVRVTITSGSNGHNPHIDLGTFRCSKDGNRSQKVKP